MMPIYKCSFRSVTVRPRRHTAVTRSTPQSSNWGQKFWTPGHCQT